MSRKINIRLLLLRLLFIAGICIMSYPFASNWLYQIRANDDLAALDQAVEQGDHEEYANELLRAREYNKQLVGETVPDVFAIREGVADKTYESFLNARGNQIMGKIEIPVIGASLPIYHYSTEESLLKGCGHIFGSSLPVGGEDSHAVITAHRGLPSAKLFTDLDQVRLGDRFYITVLDQTLAYEVDSIEVVTPEETRSLAIQRGKDMVTLVTCTPYGVNTDRLLVRGMRVPYEPEEEKKTVLPHPSFALKIIAQVACIVFGAVAAVGLRKFVERRHKRKESGDGQQNE